MYIYKYIYIYIYESDDTTLQFLRDAFRSLVTVLTLQDLRLHPAGINMSY